MLEYGVRIDGMLPCRWLESADDGPYEPWSSADADALSPPFVREGAPSGPRDRRHYFMAAMRPRFPCTCHVATSNRHARNHARCVPNVTGTSPAFFCAIWCRRKVSPSCGAVPEPCCRSNGCQTERRSGNTTAFSTFSLSSRKKRRRVATVRGRDDTHFAGLALISGAETKWR